MVAATVPVVTFINYREWKECSCSTSTVSSIIGVVPTTIMKSSQAKPTGCKDFKVTSGERAYSTQAPIQAQKYHVPVVLSSSGFVSL